MQLMRLIIYSCAIQVLWALPLAKAEQPMPIAWKKLASLPDREGFAGMFAGMSNNAIIVAGGANFPEKKPWEGGTKHWHDSIFVLDLDQPNGAWKLAGRLPRALGYGVSATWGQDVYCFGGADGDRHYADALRLRWKDQNQDQDRTIQIDRMPSLPMPFANGCGELVGRTVYLAGGAESPSSTEASRGFWTMDLEETPPRWRMLVAWPGPGRILAVAGVLDNAFYLMSGASLSSGAKGEPVRTYLKDAYRYKKGEGWRRIADLPHAVTGAPSPALALGSSRLAILGGDDGSLVDFEPKSAHPGFSRQIWAYNPAKDAWISAGEIPKAAARVTTPLISTQGHWIMPSGEIRPGVRSPEVWSMRWNELDKR